MSQRTISIGGREKSQVDSMVCGFSMHPDCVAPFLTQYPEWAGRPRLLSTMLTNHGEATAYFGGAGARAMIEDANEFLAIREGDL